MSHSKQEAVLCQFKSHQVIVAVDEIQGLHAFSHHYYWVQNNKNLPGTVAFLSFCSLLIRSHNRNHATLHQSDKLVRTLMPTCLIVHLFFQDLLAKVVGAACVDRLHDTSQKANKPLSFSISACERVFSFSPYLAANLELVVL